MNKATASRLNAAASVVAGLVLAAATLLCVLSASAETDWAACRPSLDVAEYLNRALDLRAALANGALFDALSEPGKHPPLHPATTALAIGLSTAGPLLTASRLALAESVGAMVALIGLGAWLEGRRGAWAGAVAATVAAFTLEHQRLLLAPMTEPLSLLGLVVALAVVGYALRQRTTCSALAAGLAIAAAGLVRYSLAPALIITAALGWLALAVATRPDPKSVGRASLYVAPTALLVGAWELLRPGALSAVRAFFRNVDSGLSGPDLWLWAPRTLAEEYLGLGTISTTALLSLSLLGTALSVRRTVKTGRLDALAVVGLAGWVCFAMGALHPYKLARTLHGAVPLLAMVATGALIDAVALRLRSAGALVAGALGAAILALQLGTERAQVERPECIEGDPYVLLGQIVEATASAEDIVISGAHHAVSSDSVQLQLRLAAAERAIEGTPPIPPDCAPESVEQRCLPLQAFEALRRVAAGDAVALVVLDKGKQSGGMRAGTHWAVINAAHIADRAAALGVPPVRFPIERGGGEVLVYAWKGSD